MFPLSLAKTGEMGVVEKIKGTEETKAHLQDLGFVKGAEIKIVSIFNENVIVCVKGTRIGLHSDMAKQIYIDHINQGVPISCTS